MEWSTVFLYGTPFFVIKFWPNLKEPKINKMMNRRHFLQLSTATAGALSLFPTDSFAESKDEKSTTYKMGYQLFSIRDKMKTDPVGILKKLKSFGYQDFEIYGMDVFKQEVYGMSVADFKKTLDRLSLTATSGHYAFTNFFEASERDLLYFVDGCIKGAKTLQSPFITWPWLDPKFRTKNGFEKLGPKLNLIGKHIQSAGLGFAYHNHGFEFEKFGQETGFDIILKNTDPEVVKLQMDMYWVMHSANFTPKELVEKQKGRIVMWHVKDMDKVTRDYTELGNGSIDYTQIMPDPKTSGLQYYYIEQGGNFTNDSLKSAEFSAAFFKKNLKDLI